MKNHALSSLLFLLGLLAPIQVLAIAIGFLVVADVVTGVWASLKAKQRVTSDRFGRTVTKSGVYLVALVVAHVAEAYVFGGAVPVTKVVSGLVGTTELISIYENLSRISGLDFKRAIAERLMPAQRDKEDRGS